MSEQIADTKEREEQAQLIIDSALRRVRELGYGVLADGTVYGNAVWFDTLRVRRVDGTEVR